MRQMGNFFIEQGQWIVLIGGIITLLGAIFVNIKAKRDSDDNQRKQEELLTQSLKINNLMTGGESYPMIFFHDIDHEFGYCFYSVANRGEYPLYVTDMSITDDLETQKVLNDPKNMTPKGIDASLLAPYRRNYELRDIMPQNALTMGSFPFFLKDGGSFTITFTARNGTFSQHILIHKTATFWLFAERIMTFPGNKVIFQSVPKNFPTKLISW